jgi:hypothetical protein
MNLPDNDLDLERRLARNERLFPEARERNSVEPPAELDRLVLAKARAVLKDPASNEDTPGFFTLNQWALPVGLAATLVLSLAVFLRLPDRDQVPVLTSAPPPPVPAEAAAASAPSLEAKAEANTAEIMVDAPTRAATAPAVAGMERMRSDAAITAQVPAPVPVAADEARAEVAAAAAPSIMTAPPMAGPEMVVSAAARNAASADAGMAAKAADEAERRASADSAGAGADPVAWYRRILELRKAGMQREADLEWSALQRQFPEFKPPP